MMVWKAILFIPLLLSLSFVMSKKPNENNPKKVEVETTTTPTTRVNHDNNTVDLMAIMDECNETFITEKEYINALNENGSFPDETDRTPKCYIRCVLEKAKVASEDGQYDPAVAAAVFNADRTGRQMDNVEDLARTCADRKEACKCDRAYKFMKCLMELEIEQYDKLQ